MKFKSCLVMGWVGLLLMMMSAAARPAMGQEENAASDAAMKKCQEAMDNVIDQPDLESRLKEPLIALLQLPDASKQLTHLLEFNREKAPAICNVLRQGPTARVLTVLEGVQWPGAIRENWKLGREILAAVPEDQRLALAEQCERPTEWAMGLTDQFAQREPDRVEGMLCKWAEVALVPDPQDQDERQRDHERDLKKDLLTALVKLDTKKTINAFSAGVDRLKDETAFYYLTTEAFSKLDNSQQPEAMELLWSVAHGRIDFQGNFCFRAIDSLGRKADLSRYEDLLKIMDGPENVPGAPFWFGVHNRLLAQRAQRLRNATPQPTTRPAIIQQWDQLMAADLSWPEKSRQGVALLNGLLDGPNAPADLQQLSHWMGNQDVPVFQLLLACDSQKVQSAVIPILLDRSLSQWTRRPWAGVLGSVTHSCDSQPLLKMLQQQESADSWSASAAMAYMKSQPEQVDAIAMKWIDNAAKLEDNRLLPQLVELKSQLHGGTQEQSLAMRQSQMVFEGEILWGRRAHWRQLVGPVDQLLQQPDASSQIEQLMAQSSALQENVLPKVLMACNRERVQSVMVALLKGNHLVESKKSFCATVLKQCTRNCQDLALLDLAEKENASSDWAMEVAGAFAQSQPVRVQTAALQWALQENEGNWALFNLLRDLDTPETYQAAAEFMKRQEAESPEGESEETLWILAHGRDYLANSRNAPGMDLLWEQIDGQDYYRLDTMDTLQVLAQNVPPNQLEYLRERARKIIAHADAWQAEYARNQLAQILEERTGIHPDPMRLANWTMAQMQVGTEMAVADLTGQSKALTRCLFYATDLKQYQQEFYVALNHLLQEPDAANEFQRLMQEDDLDSETVMELLRECDPALVAAMLDQYLSDPKTPGDVSWVYPYALGQVTRSSKAIHLLEDLEKSDHCSDTSIAMAFVQSQPNRVEAMALRWAKGDLARIEIEGHDEKSAYIDTYHGLGCIQILVALNTEQSVHAVAMAMQQWNPPEEEGGDPRRMMLDEIAGAHWPASRWPEITAGLWHIARDADQTDECRERAISMLTAEADVAQAKELLGLMDDIETNASSNWRDRRKLMAIIDRGNAPAAGSANPATAATQNVTTTQSVPASQPAGK